MQLNEEVDDVQALTDKVDTAFHYVPSTSESIHTRVCRIVRENMPKGTSEDTIETKARLVEACRRNRLETKGRARSMDKRHGQITEGRVRLVMRTVPRSNSDPDRKVGIDRSVPNGDQD